MKNELNFQDRMLSVLRQQGQQVTVFLTNGFQIRGVVRGFDSYIVIVDSDGKQQMIYKHAISTIVPQRRVELLRRDEQVSAAPTQDRGIQWNRTASEN